MNPFDWTEETDLKTKQDCCFYWMQKSYMLNLEKKALMALLEDKGINITMREILDMMNKISSGED